MTNNLSTESEFRKKLDSYSTSFCAAKWWNSTIWLGSGVTTSCHHPPWNHISKKVNKNPKLLHNTKQKKKDRKKMLAGKRPKGCDYCWKFQDADPSNIPDRVYKSMIYDKEELDLAFNSDPNQDVNLKTLEISFDRTCNFSCSYCSPGFSSTWVKDINKNGPYEHLVSQGRFMYMSNHPEAQKYRSGSDDNPYVNAFWQWWETDLKNTLKELRITGGEPTLSPELWRLLASIKEQQSTNSNLQKLKLAVNSNLGTSADVFNKLKKAIDGISYFDLYTSCEATGQQAEYIRSGLDYKVWLSRVKELVLAENVQMINVMATINALCLWTLTDLLFTNNIKIH